MRSCAKAASIAIRAQQVGAEQIRGHARYQSLASEECDSRSSCFLPAAEPRRNHINHVPGGEQWLLHTFDFNCDPDHAFYPAHSRRSGQLSALGTHFLWQNQRCYRGANQAGGTARIMMAQGMVIGLLLVMAAIAGAVCVWLSLRGNARAGKASAAAAGVAQPPPQRTPMPEMVSPPDSSLSAIRRAITPGAALLETQVLNGPQTFHLMYELAFGALAHQTPPPQDLRLISRKCGFGFREAGD